jgi:hypothetical protein
MATPILSDHVQAIDQSKTNRLASSILLKKCLWRATKSKSRLGPTSRAAKIQRLAAGIIQTYRDLWPADHWRFAEGYGTSEPVTSKEAEHA